MRRMKLSENFVFLGMIFMVFVFGFYTFVKNQKSTSIAENRSLVQFSHFTLGGFISGDFQDKFESAFSDQFPFSEKIRMEFGQAIERLPKYGIDSLACANRYLVLKAGSGETNRAIYDCNDYIVIVPDRQVNKVALDNIQKYNTINRLNDVYYYYIKGGNSYDFVEDKVTVDYEKLLSENLKGNYHLASLDMDGWEKYKEYYYKTDHHWNYIGSYQGFLDIAKMFGIKNPSVPTGTFTSEEFFFGSASRMTLKYDIFEKFTIYTFDIPEHDTMINGVEKKYNHISEFINHDYKYNKNRNFYGEVYGADYGEIVFDFHQPEKPNLLIVSNSFSNAVNELIAQYFNKTYVVDLRYYKEQRGSDFKYSEYIKNNHIDKTLIMADLFFLVMTTLNQGLEL